MLDGLKIQLTSKLTYLPHTKALEVFVTPSRRVFLRIWLKWYAFLCLGILHILVYRRAVQILKDLDVQNYTVRFS